MPSEYANRLVSVAIGEHQQFAGVLETDKRLRNRIYDTYLADLRAADPDDELGWEMPSNISKWAWSAAFVSWCVLEAGASADEFDFSVRHAMYINRTIANTDGDEGVFRARKIDEYAPIIGDLICENREGGTITYDQARDRTSYPSHTAIVVEFVEYGTKRYAVTVGGNEGDSIRRTEVELTKAGLVKNRAVEPYICVIECMKDEAAELAVAAVAPIVLEATGALSPSFRGHGTFVYDAVSTAADYGSADNVAKAMVRAGMRHVWVRVHGRQPLSTAQKAATMAIVNAARDAGLAIAGWGWCQGEDAKGEARTALREIERYNLLDYIADIEPGHNNSVWTVGEVEDFCQTVRDNLPGSFGISSFALVDWHEPHLMRAALPFVDAFAPQVYWFKFPNKQMVEQFKKPDGTDYPRSDPGAYSDLCLDRWTKLATTSPKPLILTGQAYWGEGDFDQHESEAKLQTFLDNWRAFDRIAGLNWWHFGGGSAMSHAMLEAIVDADLGTKVPV